MTDVIFSPYFTKDLGYSQHDSSHGGKGGSKPDDFRLIGDWYRSVDQLGLHAVVFNNELSRHFTKELTTDKISFHRHSETHRPSYNDERFWAYLSYLNAHEEIENVFCTDIFDVVFLRNPFKLLGKHPEYALFCGSEPLNVYSSRWMRVKCKGMNFPLAREGYMPGGTLYNAGIIGGPRGNVIRFFKSMVQEMGKIDRKHNANMPVFNWCLDQTKWPIYTGHPLHNRFGSHEADSHTYIKHK